jgi:hypothetical protein
MLITQLDCKRILETRKPKELYRLLYCFRRMKLRFAIRRTLLPYYCSPFSNFLVVKNASALLYHLCHKNIPCKCRILSILHSYVKVATITTLFHNTIGRSQQYFSIVGDAANPYYRNPYLSFKACRLSPGDLPLAEMRLCSCRWPCIHSGSNMCCPARSSV